MLPKVEAVHALQYLGDENTFDMHLTRNGSFMHKKQEQCCRAAVVP